eukprot:104381_1
MTRSIFDCTILLFHSIAIDPIALALYASLALYILSACFFFLNSAHGSQVSRTIVEQAGILQPHFFPQVHPLKPHLSFVHGSMFCSFAKAIFAAFRSDISSSSVIFLII